MDTRLSLHSFSNIQYWIYNASNIISWGGNTLLSINDYDTVSYDGDNISISIKESIVETNLADRWMLMRMKMIGKDCWRCNIMIWRGYDLNMVRRLIFSIIWSPVVWNCHTNNFCGNAFIPESNYITLNSSLWLGCKTHDSKWKTQLTKKGYTWYDWTWFLYTRK